MTGPEYRVWTDGASRGNPGPSAIGVSVRDGDDREVAVASEAIGRATNNVAEYRALLKALDLLRELGATRARFHLDSQLIVRQMTGEYRVKDPKMRALSLEVMKRIRDLVSYSFHHVPRAENKRADALANRALDRD